MSAPITCRKRSLAGAELSFALATAIALLDSIRARPEVSAAAFPPSSAHLSFFVNAGMRFVTELSKMRAFVDLWDEITLGRYGVAEEQHRRFRYGVQVNSLGLTEPQPENNVYRILIEMLAVTLSRRRAPGPCSSRRGTRRSACRAPSTSNGRSGCSRSSPMRDRPSGL